MCRMQMTDRLRRGFCRVVCAFTADVLTLQPRIESFSFLLNIHLFRYNRA